MRIVFYLVFLSSLVACNMVNDKQTLRLAINADTTFILKKNVTQGNIWGIDLKIIGNFEDTIVLIHTNGDNVAYKYKLIGGVDTLYCTDWYSDSCLIEIMNLKKPIKEMQIDFEFYD